MPHPTTVGFLLIPGFALMSYAAAVEPLRAVNQLSGKTLYRWWHAAPGKGPVAASNGVAIIPDFTPKDAAAADIVFVCAGGNPATFDDPATFAWLRRLARKGITIGGISGGPYVLAKAGLLDGRRATLHWEHAAAFHEAFPNVDVVPSLFVLDGDRITCSGGVSALDMMVALVARDHGHDLAAAVGEWFLLTHIREGMGPQRMDLRHRLGISDEGLLAVLRAMEANLEQPKPRADLARLAGVSLRQLERMFSDRLGRGVHAHYLALRLERARQLLRETSLSVLDVAIATGFGSASQFARAFARAHGEPPSLYRKFRDISAASLPVVFSVNLRSSTSRKPSAPARTGRRSRHR
jgi:transcriptional regulator GlxA family with amidase domain